MASELGLSPAKRLLFLRCIIGQVVLFHEYACVRDTGFPLTVAYKLESFMVFPEAENVGIFTVQLFARPEGIDSFPEYGIKEKYATDALKII